MDEDLVSIHQKALQKVYFSPPASSCDRDPEVSLLKQQLAALRKRRLDLSSEIQKLEFEQRLLPLSEELRTHTLRTTRQHVDDSYRHFLEKPPAPSKEKDDEKGLARRMQSLRKRRRIVGSHRIAGVSIAPSQHYDDNILTVRIDVCVEGRYTAKHFMFFDIITTCQTEDDEQEGEPQYFLRLAQHTLQPSIPLTKVLRQHFGGELMLRLTTTALLTEDVMIKLRNLVGTLQDVCYAHAVRRQGVECLEKQIHSNTQHGISNLVVTRDTLRRIDFDATFANHRGETRTLTIKLIYDDELSPLPTTVSATSQQNESDDDDPQFSTGASKVLQSKPLWRFLEEGRRLLWRTHGE